MITVKKENGVLRYANEPDVNRELMGGRMLQPAAVTGLSNADQVIDIPGIPHYIEADELSDYSSYSLTETGWYVFASISSDGNGVVSESLTVTGAAGYVAHTGDSHIDVAVRFETAAVSQTVVVDWGVYTQTVVFHATDLAILNLDYRTTFYVYDAAAACTWQFALTTDTTFAEDKTYYTKDGDVYTPAEVTVGAEVPSDTYYQHSKLVIDGTKLTSNVTYRFDEIVDCPSEFILPAVDDDTHGCWYEIRMRHAGTYSTQLTTPGNDIKVATEHTQPETKGINMIDLHYTAVAGSKVWRFMNTHSTIPT